MSRLACVVLVLATVGCKKQPHAPPPPEISEVRVVYKGADLPGAPKLDVAALTAAARAAIAASSGVPVREDGGVDSTRPRRYRLRVELEIGSAEDPVTHKGNLRALVDAKLSPIGGRSERALVRADGAGRARLHAGQAGRAGVAGARRARHPRLRLRRRRARQARRRRHRARSSPPSTAPTTICARRGCASPAERKDPRAVPAVLRRLKSDDSAERDRAIGALAAIGDRRAVRPLTEVAKFNDLTDLPKVLDALATIGGPEARSYLEFVASGHESSEMRDLAKEALTHLERRQAAQGRDMLR